MSDHTFAASWLALREPVDHRARPLELAERLSAWWVSSDACRVLDLGSGTGSNLRYLAPYLGDGQRWTLLDRDASLLEYASEVGGEVPGVATVRPVVADLDPEGVKLASEADLVTASALLDLATGDWLGRLTRACRDVSSAVLLSLTWDGTFAFGRPDVDDAFVVEAVRRHQLRDKGMGPALGPEGGPAAERALRAAGYDTWARPSPWRLGDADAPLAQALVQGWLEAASEERPDAHRRVERWAARRHTTIEGRFTLDVGHVDLLALPRPGPT